MAIIRVGRGDRSIRSYKICYSKYQIKQYIEDILDDPGFFKIWDEPDKPKDTVLESDSSDNSDDFTL